jgi:hypothetical protein
MNQIAGTRLIKLADRSSAGIHVSLFLVEGDADDKAVVCVRDTREGKYFEIPTERYLALDVYYHPFAYRDFSTAAHSCRGRCCPIRVAPRQPPTRRVEVNGSNDHTLVAPARVVLAERRAAGIWVRLLWAEDTNSVAVLLDNDGTGDRFELSLEPGINALDAFDHPYAYAAWRGVDFGLADLRRAG